LTSDRDVIMMIKGQRTLRRPRRHARHAYRQAQDDCLSPHDDGDLRTFIELCSSNEPEPRDGFTRALDKDPTSSASSPLPLQVAPVPAAGQA
jgi:hypothetical protein